ncbi:PilZ domain-containing protein [Geothermobacter ehrlichii]|uniref:PilZ domain-containing protein n=1 Tax=Geothermobacter ehrlichii TaxID=213224 RepID=A0A5D3WNI3_9BACT|nr:response regulator [Geothermobacter ehrlichii]TYO99893.1 PilZ domain-containing protein [Geothermobacter ehrlichii]
MNRLIVLVDDSKTFSMYIGLLLKRMGFDVVPAETVEIGLKMVRVLKPDLVLVDRFMPGVDGTELIRLLKGDPALAEIPVVLVSASEERGLEAEARKYRADGYLLKPITPYALHRVLTRIFGRRDGPTRQRLRCSYREKVGLLHAGSGMSLPAVSLSEGGIYLRHPDPLPVGSEVELLLPLPEGELRLSGRVIYQKDVFRDSLRIEPGMAILFENVDDGTRERLRSVISDLLAGDLVEEQQEGILSLD